jgi:hypothetical protein
VQGSLHLAGLAFKNKNIFLQGENAPFKLLSSLGELLLFAQKRSSRLLRCRLSSSKQSHKQVILHLGHHSF